MNYNNLCYKCFNEKPIQGGVCRQCGYQLDLSQVPHNCLLPGSILHGRYLVGIALGAGGFGITYKCLDTQMGGVCAVKEYFPSKFAHRAPHELLVSVHPEDQDKYSRIMKRFLEEAELLKTLKHDNVIETYDSFTENNTAYYVMEFCDGEDLRRYTGNFTRKLGYDEGMNLLYQTMNGLEYIHSKRVLHRDIAPDNIYVTKNNTVKILDFGSARREMDQVDKILSVIVKMGYAPVEQYAGQGRQGNYQGPYTDIYALGATFYQLFTSVIPVESTQRVASDPLIPFSQLRPDLPDELKYCIEKAMRVNPKDRIQNVHEMRTILRLPTGAATVSAIPAEDFFIRIDSELQNNSEIPRAPVKEKGVTLGARFGAYLIDSLIWGAAFYGLLFLILDYEQAGFSRVCALFPIAFALINTVLEWTLSATIGKAILGLTVTDKAGERIMPSQALLRNLIKILGIFCLLFSKKGKLLEDRVTDSAVRRKN